jgi:hypothetical protein
MKRACELALFVALLVASAVRAQPLTTAFTYQGELRNSGSPVSGLYDLRFRLYDAALGGTQVGSTLCSDNTTLTNGRFTIPLDFGAQFVGQQRYLEIDVRPDSGLDCSSSAGFTTLSSAGFTTLGPRQALTAAPYADFALNTASAGNASQLNGQGASFYQNAANLSSGTIPSARLSGPYSGALNLSNTANTFAGSGAGLTSLNASSLATGTLPDARLSPNVPRLNGPNAFDSSTNAFLGNVGIGTATPGMRLTVAGDMEMGTSSGDYRKFRIGGGNSDGFVYGSWPGLGDGVHFGYNWYADAAGAGHVVNTGGQTSRISASYGSIVLATGDVNQSPSPRLTVGADGKVGIGASGSSISRAYVFSSEDLQGLRVDAAASAIVGNCFSAGAGGYGVVGATSNSSSAWSVYGFGNLGATGTKSFRIDHPTDPENKYLLHYCAEAPEPQNVYNGNATLDPDGHATVLLPSYFAAINREPRYTLTAIGAPMPMLHIARKIPASDLAAGAATNPGETIPQVSFEIAGGAPGGEVSWRVDALRNDRWVQRHGAPVEYEKPGHEKGMYQEPDLYDQPAERGMRFHALAPAPTQERAR